MQVLDKVWPSFDLVFCRTTSKIEESSTNFIVSLVGLKSLIVIRNSNGPSLVPFMCIRQKTASDEIVKTVCSSQAYIKNA